MRLAIVVLSMLGLPAPAQAAWIELHNPNYGLPYCLTMDYFGAPSFFVLLHPEGATNIVGARLRVSGLPPGCSVAVTPSSSASHSAGDLFSAGGAEIVFASPQTGPSQVLYEVTLSCPGSVLVDWGYVTLQPDAVQPVLPGFECPVVITAEPAQVCAGYTAMSDHPIWCEIGVAPVSWGAAKALYR